MQKSCEPREERLINIWGKKVRKLKFFVSLLYFSEFQLSGVQGQREKTSKNPKTPTNQS